MNVMMRAGICAGATTLALTSVGFAGTANDADSQDLKQRLAAAEAKIAELEAANGEGWMTEERATEIRSLVQDVLADADTRASMLQGIGAGYDNGFWLSNSDGSYSLKINGGIQARFVWNTQDDDSGVDHYRYGFENTITRLSFSGNVVNPDWTYKIQGGFDRGSTGDFNLEDGYINYNYGEGWSITVGQYKAPLLREELVDEFQHQLVEASIVMHLFTADRTQGIMVNYTGDSIRGNATFHDGANSLNSAWVAEDTEWAFAGRIEWQSGDNWARFDDFQSWRDEEGFAILIGGAANWQNGEYGTGTGTGATFQDFEAEVITLTADATLEFGGANLFGAVIYNMLDANAPPGFTTTDADQLAFVIQGGFFFTDDIEGFARYEWCDFDFGGVEDLNVVTVGFAKYFARNNAKWQTDVGFGIDEVALAPEITGFRTDPTDADAQIVVRTQFQLAF